MSIVIIGSGLAGVSVAHSLLADFGPQLAASQVEDVILVDKSTPLGLTSSASTGGYRNFFPADKMMTQFVTRSIRRFESLAAQSGNGWDPRFGGPSSPDTPCSVSVSLSLVVCG